MTRQEPVTEEGRALLAAWANLHHLHTVNDCDPFSGILAIEAESLAAARTRIEALPSERGKFEHEGAECFDTGFLHRSAVLEALALPSDAPEKP